MYKIFFAFILLLSTFQSTRSQQVQIVKGSVTDRQTKQGLPGASVVLLDTTVFIATTTNADGYYKLANVGLGRKIFRISYLGYKEKTFTVIVTSGKEVVTNIELEENAIQGKEVEVSATREKARSNNQMATVSARSFTFEETSRYAGSLNDPARMAGNYAGVSSSNDSRNDIVIRGNSPAGLLWRLNGVDIPNPNHFGSLGTTGGPISILNNNQLDNSDFITAAFPAEYGNALAGVFDLQMRHGNDEKHEFLFQMGFNGFEGGAEGPIHKASKSTYLINYRYSTLGVFKSLGINFGTGNAVPQYQDVSFNFNFPTKRAGRFSFFGIGGKAYVETLDKDKDSTKNSLYDNEERQNGYFGNNTGVAGLQHLYVFKNGMYVKTTLATSALFQNWKVDSISNDDNIPYPFYRNNSYNIRSTLTSTFNKRFNSRNFLKSGIILEQYDFQYADSISRNLIFRIITNTKGASQLLQAYSQWQHNINSRLTINTGLHFQQFMLNKSFNIEPRVGVRYEINRRNTLSFGTGLHSQIQPIYIYLVKTRLDAKDYLETNRNLDLTKSAHFVFAYDYSFKKDYRIKAELYYQYIYDVPVETQASGFSILNEGADFNFSSRDSLLNNGTGDNKGIELTIEKFYSQGFYFLITTSLFNSKYEGSDKVRRNTAFNGNYIFNILAGKEITIHKRHVFAINIRTTYSGGKRFIPIDLEQSFLQNASVYDETRAYENKFKDYFRTDVKFSYRINYKKATHEISLDINNIFNTKNIWQQQYNPGTGNTITEYQVGFFPIPLYRLYF